MQTLDQIVGGSPVFDGLDAEHLELIAGCGHIEAVQAGDRLFREGDPAETFYLVRRGRIALTTHVPGRGDVVIETLEPGEVIGWSWLFPPYVWHFDARTTEPTSALFFYGTILREYCAKDPSLGFELFKRMSQVMIERLQSARARLLSSHSTQGKAKSPAKRRP